jgi:transcriptional regulator with GAF, ATPase, and Fis domain
METKLVVSLTPKRREGAACSDSTLSSPFLATEKAEGCEDSDIKTRELAADDDLLKSTIADFERHIIVSALKQTHGNQSKAAMRLGTTKRILSCRVRKYGIDLGQFCKRTDRTKRQKG